jgi:hypothetical protein
MSFSECSRSIIVEKKQVIWSGLRAAAGDKLPVRGSAGIVVVSGPMPLKRRRGQFARFQ